MARSRRDHDDDYLPRKRRRKTGQTNWVLPVAIGGAVLVVVLFIVLVLALKKDKSADNGVASNTADPRQNIDQSPATRDPIKTPVAKKDEPKKEKNNPPTKKPFDLPQFPKLGDGLKLPDGFKVPDGIKLPDGLKLPDGKPPRVIPDPTGGITLNEANFRKIKRGMTRAQIEEIFGKPHKASPSKEDRAEFILGEPTWTDAVFNVVELPGYSRFLWIDTNAGMELNFRVDQMGREFIHGGGMTLRTGPPSQGSKHVMLRYFSIDDTITRIVEIFQPGGMRQ